VRNLVAGMAAVADVLAEERARRAAILTVTGALPDRSDAEVAEEVERLGHRKPPDAMVRILRQKGE